tara:strand:+ start:100 stop:462 length:363 start_codon:yes stop_codon:yes gene_type:complete
MANEGTVTAGIRIVNGNSIFVQNALSKAFDQAAIGGPTPGAISVGTSEESTAFPELSTEGWLFMQNNDSTNYVQWGFATGVYGGRLKAGEFALFRMEPGLTLYLKANTAACNVLVYGFEN